MIGNDVDIKIFVEKIFNDMGECMAYNYVWGESSLGRSVCNAIINFGKIMPKAERIDIKI